MARFSPTKRPRARSSQCASELPFSSEQVQNPNFEFGSCMNARPPPQDGPRVARGAPPPGWSSPLRGGGGQDGGLLTPTTKNRQEKIQKPASSSPTRALRERRGAPRPRGWAGYLAKSKEKHTNEAWQTTPHRRFKSPPASPSRDMCFPPSRVVVVYAGY